MRLSRRTLLISAAAPVLALAAARPHEDYVWRGFALGADAEIRLSGVERLQAERSIAAVTAEVERLENIFSLYRPDSEISRLNGGGVLHRPSQDFRLLLGQSLAFWRGTEGAFNPAIQPLWRHLAEHFASTGTPPDERRLAALLPLCDPTLIVQSDSAVTLAPGMALTFNGIAQGYITDRVADIFAAHGLDRVLVNMGEIRALDGRFWTIAAAGGRGLIRLQGRAIAQSAGSGTPFTSDGRWHHLIDPRTGHSANDLRAVTVEAATATDADALSTAAYVATPEQRQRIAARYRTARLQVQQPARPT